MIEFTLPHLGADVEEGKLLEWKVQPGDVVKKGQVVAIVDTSKAAVDVECWQEGTVHQLVAQPGDTLPVGGLMATLLAPGEQPAAPHLASPAARKRAHELNVDLETVTGTGPHGVVTREDVEQAAASVAPTAPTPPAEDKAAAMRRAIGAAMARSKREIPHYYVSETVPLGKALAWLQAQNAARPMNERLLPAALLLKAVARTVQHFPELNGFYSEEVFKPSAPVHLGVAISLRQGGLIAPALLDAATKPLTPLMQELADLVKRTRAGSLRSSEMSEATITVTNLGDQGTEAVYGVIYPPQVALVGLGRIVERPWVESGELIVMPTVVASLSADHRVSDGHRGSLFLMALREALQHPEELDS
jgi:pyruvate dehydrogenase E2 component (dihydrolipoamide acetyltransferase)